MNTRYATRMEDIKGSAIRALLKLADQPDIISFAGGFPAPEFFPVKEMIEVGIKALQYGPTEGLPALRRHISKLMQVQKLNANISEILITSGSQQGLDMAGMLFIDSGDVVITESPSYLGALNAFKAYHPTFVEVEMDEHGMLMDKLVRLWKQTREKLNSFIPSLISRIRPEEPCRSAAARKW